MAKKTEIETKVEVEFEERIVELDPEHLELIIGDMAEIGLYIESKIARIKKISDSKMQIADAFASLEVVRTMAYATERKVCIARENTEEEDETESDNVSISLYANGPSKSLMG